MAFSSRDQRLPPLVIFKATATRLSIARGGVVDQAALTAALGETFP
ncbi:hypothetical protein [Sphingopyxis sp. MWB1]|nr:hypothetical protein [Sphingopyxis sp. MWB1]